MRRLRRVRRVRRLTRSTRDGRTWRWDAPAGDLGRVLDPVEEAVRRP
ncbi:hypothetical protein GCM10027605_47620 [Micromonospora zhanjiangensis]